MSRRRFPRLGRSSPICLALACSLLAWPLLVESCDLLRLTPLCVVDWTPGDGFHPATDARVSVRFNIEPDRVSVENAFSIVCDGEALAGRFEWDGVTLDFVPQCPLRSNAEYRITVGADAGTPKGFSMERAFEARFTTRPEVGRPSVVSTVPACFGYLTDPYGIVVALFSEAIDAASFRDALVLTPSIAGDWSLDGSGTAATFTPRESWRPGIEYRLDISAGLLDQCGNSMGQDYSTVFIAGLDGEPPVLLGIDAVDGATAMPLAIDDPSDSILTDNHRFESTWDLRLRFSEPVAVRTLASRLFCDGGPALVLQTSSDSSDEALFHFERRPDFGSHLVVRTRPGIADAAGNAMTGEAVCRITVDGPGSRPPRLVGIRLPLAPGAVAIADRCLVAFGLDAPFATLALGGEPERYPVGVPTMVTIELYFELASGATLDLFSLRQSFGMSATNAALEFQPLLVEPGGLSWAQAYAPWSECSVARVSGTLTNRANTGVVTVSLAAGFCDSLGNVMAAPQGLPLLK